MVRNGRRLLLISRDFSLLLKFKTNPELKGNNVAEKNLINRSNIIKNTRKFKNLWPNINSKIAIIELN